MAFFLYKEYQLEKLAESFADNVYDRRQVGEITPENLLAAHTVIVQTRGMGEYLRQVLAEKKQIAGNLQMPFPDDESPRGCYQSLPHQFTVCLNR